MPAQKQQTAAKATGARLARPYPPGLALSCSRRTRIAVPRRSPCNWRLRIQYDRATGGADARHLSAPNRSALESNLSPLRRANAALCFVFELIPLKNRIARQKELVAISPSAIAGICASPKSIWLTFPRSLPSLSPCDAAQPYR